MRIEEVKEDSGLKMIIDGKIDTLTCNEFQNAVLKAFQKTNNLIIDMESVTYVSSAGLRALIIGQRTAETKGGSLSVINASDSVKDVFRVTGFDKVLDIR
ncbi:MAG: STAS domain-containing protein [Lachnospiraceae bacterium]|nr:STAS domain-containing protein [Lachnospiraceae bacterium]